MIQPPHQPVILCVLDGWGEREDSHHNGIKTAKTPVWNRFLRAYPHAQLQASEQFVGLPKGQMGNSEVGHMTLGAGRVLLQDLPRIDKAIEDGTLAAMPAFLNFIAKLKKSGGTCHLLGLLSPGGIHSHQRHITTLAHILANHQIPVKVHAFLDGRDTPPQSAYDFVKTFLTDIAKAPLISLATLTGRYFALDRDQRWERIEKAYHAIVDGRGTPCSDPLQSLKNVYKQGLGDEFIPPFVIQDYKGIEDKDGLLMANFRSDRVRQILSSLLEVNFSSFPRPRQVAFTATLGMTEYSAELNSLIPPLFNKQELTHGLGQCVAEAGLKQLRIAETEKYAHVTFFFNGGRETVFAGESRILIPSPKVATYDLNPEMSAYTLTDQMIKAISTQQYALIVLNYANADMVGHTGIPTAIIEAIETLDQCLGRLEEAAKANGYVLIITADHGNAEQMVDETTGMAHTSHTCNPVPVVLVNGPKKYNHLRSGELKDIAPTILQIIGLTCPQEMTGKSLTEIVK